MNEMSPRWRIDTASSWSDLQELLFDGSWNEGLGRFRSP